MAIKRIYFQEDNFALTLIYGSLTNAEIGQHVIEMNQECADHVGMMELADCRYLTDTSDLNASNLAFTASLENGQSRIMGGKGAIVVSSDEVYALARTYASVAENIRADSQVFRDMDKAMTWLGIGHLKYDIMAHSEAIAE